MTKKNKDFTKHNTLNLLTITIIPSLLSSPKIYSVDLRNMTVTKIIKIVAKAINQPYYYAYNHPNPPNTPNR